MGDGYITMPTGTFAILDNILAFREPEMPTQSLQGAMGDLCNELQVPIPDDLSLKPSGNEVTALLHWRSLMALISLVEARQEEFLRSQYALTEEEMASLPQEQT